ESSPSNTINTSLIERSNLNWRLWDSHLTRKSLCVSKYIQHLRAKFAISFLFYNFIIPHSTLSKRINPITNQKKNLPKTPAMASGIANRPMTLL
ncbi:MAG: hypothetical protein LBQ12_16110, partial [Deltaproteobacteria bacterium]|nr:hypothetical protein [Deltaproteobacteria bacterium]